MKVPFIFVCVRNACARCLDRTNKKSLGRCQGSHHHPRLLRAGEMEAYLICIKISHFSVLKISIKADASSARNCGN